MPIFRRLMGLETEYALRFEPDDRGTPRPQDVRLVRSLIEQLRRRLPIAEDRHFSKEGWFLPNGGALWLERQRHTGGHCLLEGSTPECRGPRTLLRCQRAMDDLLEELSGEVGLGGRLTLIKNDRDSRDNVYGAQENYEAEIARGPALLLWRAGLLLLMPVVLVSWLSMVIAVVAILSYLAVAGLLLLLPGAFMPVRFRRLLIAVLFGRETAEGIEDALPFPAWLDLAAYWLSCVVVVPLAVGFWLLCHAAAFGPLRRTLTPFLLSRAVIGGTGMIDRDGRFLIADKAPAINGLIGFGGLLWVRPIFVFTHFIKSACLRIVPFSRDWWSLFQRRQRLQIGLGDSNMCEEAEYLRIATTLLVIDATEAGALKSVPRIKRPIRALRRLLADPQLNATVSSTDGRQWTALQLQQFYWNACREFIAKRPDAPEEAHRVIELWGDTLTCLERGSAEAVGRVDWPSKQFLIERCASMADVAVRKKIDLRYHELSPDGYFRQLAAAGMTSSLLSEDEIKAACRMPPTDTPAAERGRYIREFSGSELPIVAAWNAVVIGRGWSRRVIQIRSVNDNAEKPWPAGRSIR